MENMKLQYQMDNGRWSNCQDRFDYFVGMAVDESIRLNKFNPDKYPALSREEIITKLQCGETVRFGTDWSNELRDAVAYDAKMEAKLAARKPVEMVKCDCGHTIPRISVMSASMGTSCPDCYDRMSN